MLLENVFEIWLTRVCCLSSDFTSFSLQSAFSTALIWPCFPLEGNTFPQTPLFMSIYLSLKFKLLWNIPQRCLQEPFPVSRYHSLLCDRRILTQTSRAPLPPHESDSTLKSKWELRLHCLPVLLSKRGCVCAGVQVDVFCFCTVVGA